MPLSLQNFNGRFGKDYVEMNAAIVVYLLLQRYFVSGVTTGAVKGLHTRAPSPG